MIVTLMLTALAIVREKEIGTMEQLMVTPIRPMELMLGKTLPFAIVGLIDVGLVTAVALLVFHIPFRGISLVTAGVLRVIFDDHAGRGFAALHYFSDAAAGHDGQLFLLHARRLC